MKGPDISVRLRGSVFTIMTACLFGLGAVLAKLVGEAFDPIFVSWISLFAGSLCVALWQLLRRQPLLPRMSRRAWLDLCLFASLGTALPLVCVVAGFAQTTAITGSFLMQLQGPAAILCSVLFLKEKVGWKQIGGIVLLLVGSVLVIIRSLDGSLHIDGGQGDLLIGIAALALGFSYLFAKRLTTSGDALQIIFWRLLIGSFLLLPLLVWQTHILLVPLAWTMTGTLVIYIVSQFCLAYVFQQQGLALLSAWESAALMQTLPLFSTLFALLILHESMTPLQIIGGIIIILGGFLVL